MKWLNQLSVSVAVALALTFSLEITAAGNSPVPSQTGRTANPEANYGALPLNFEANRGQVESSVQSVAHGQGYTLLLREGEAVLALSGRSVDPHRKVQDRTAQSTPASPIDSPAGSVIGMKLDGSKRQAAFTAEEPQVTRTNYFLGNDPTQWRTDIPNYARVRYSAVYPGIDLVYYGNQRRLEHDFIVAPSADPGRIRLELQGATRLHIDSPSGDLILTVKGGELRLLKPVSYQESSGRRIEVASSYKLLAGNKIGFSLASYNRAHPLVIDPVLVYSTYLGGSGTRTHGDQGNGIAVDSSGHAYVVGTTYSTNFPTKTPYQSQNYAAAYNSGATVFISKLNTAGTGLIYSTYLGGSSGDFGYGIALDAADNAYVTGATDSTDFPATCGAFLTANPSATTGAPTGFVAKLSSTGDTLVYSTFLGGSGNQTAPAQGDVSQAIAVNSAGNAYVTGYTWSANFPATTGAFQTSFAGSAQVCNAFVSELSADGAALVYSTYLGGSGTSGVGDYGNAIALDSSEDVFIVGNTSSTNFPVTQSTFQGTLNGSSKAFVTELSPGGSTEVYSTYLGGSVGDSATAVAVDAAGNAYVAGSTYSGDFPVTSETVEGTNSGMAQYVSLYGFSGFVAKLNAGGASLSYSTYLEGGGTAITGIAIDSSGAAYLAGNAPIAGTGELGRFQATPDGFATPNSQGNTAFLVKLAPDASVLNYATLMGGSASDGATAIAMDGSGAVYLTGYSFSANFPLTSGVVQTTNNAAATGGSNAFVAKFSLASEKNKTTYPIVGYQPYLQSQINATANYVMTGECSDGSCVDFDVDYSVSVTGSGDGPTPTGMITLTSFDNATSGLVTLTGGTATLNTQDTNGGLNAGDYPVAVNYSGDSTYFPSSGTATFTVPMIPTSMTASAQYLCEGYGILGGGVTMIPAWAGPQPTGAGEATVFPPFTVDFYGPFSGWPGVNSWSPPSDHNTPGGIGPIPPIYITVTGSYSGDQNYGGHRPKETLSLTIVPTSSGFPFLTSTQPLSA